MKVKFFTKAKLREKPQSEVVRPDTNPDYETFTSAEEGESKTSLPLASFSSSSLFSRGNYQAPGGAYHFLLAFTRSYTE